VRRGPGWQRALKVVAVLLQHALQLPVAGRSVAGTVGERLERRGGIAHITRVALGHGQIKVAARNVQAQRGVGRPRSQLQAQAVHPAHRRVCLVGQRFHDVGIAGGGEGRGVGQGAGREKNGRQGARERVWAKKHGAKGSMISGLDGIAIESRD
jgi:hypothetical protein